MSVTAEREGRIASRQITVQFICDVVEILSEGAEKYVTHQLSSLGPEPPAPKPGDYSKETDDKRNSRWRWEQRVAELATFRKSSVAIETTDGDHTAFDAAKLQTIRFPPNIKEIFINVGREYGEFGAIVKLRFNASMFETGSTYKIRGDDKQTVLGLEASLRQKLSEERSLRDVLYQGKYLLPIDFVIAFVNAWVLRSLISYFDASLIDPSVFVFVASLYVMPWVLRWFFPIFTYAEDSRNSIRRALKTVLAILYVALNVFGLFTQLTGYSYRVTSTQTITTTLTSITILTSFSPSPIPGFAPEAIIVGLLLGFALIISLAERRRKP